MLICGIGGALAVNLSMDIVALEIKVSSTRVGNLCMEVTFLESPPLGLKIHVPMDELGFGASSKIGNPCQDSERTTLYSIGLYSTLYLSRKTGFNLNILVPSR